MRHPRSIDCRCEVAMIDDRCRVVESLRGRILFEQRKHHGYADFGREFGNPVGLRSGYGLRPVPVRTGWLTREVWCGGQLWKYHQIRSGGRAFADPGPDPSTILPPTSL